MLLMYRKGGKKGVHKGRDNHCRIRGSKEKRSIIFRRRKSQPISWERNRLGLGEQRGSVAECAKVRAVRPSSPDRDQSGRVKKSVSQRGKREERSQQPDGLIFKIREGSGEEAGGKNMTKSFPAGGKETHFLGSRKDSLP